MYKGLENCILFKGLDEKQLTGLFDSLVYTEKHYSKDEFVAHSDEEVRDLLLVVEGVVRGEMTDFSGKTIKIEDIESPRMLAPAFLFGMNNRYPVDIVANTKVTIIALSKQTFLKLLQTNQLVLINYLNSISSRAQFLSNKIKFLSFQTIKGKIAHFLLQLIKKTGQDEFVLPKSQNELAEMFGVTRPSLGRAMRELDSEGLIKADGKNIKILDKNGLSMLLRN
jgi:CRP/FNR family transcriptional regulator, dissimilatory nitrate respiration regulator